MEKAEGLLLKIKEHRRREQVEQACGRKGRGPGGRTCGSSSSQRPVGEGRTVSNLSEGAAGLSGGKGGCILSDPQQRWMGG